MSKSNDYLPPGWEAGTDCVAFKHLEDFKYVEVRFEPEDAYAGHDYALYVVDRDGPRQEEKKGVFTDVGKALKIGDTL